MTAATATAVVAEPSASVPRLPAWRRVLMRVGLVLTTIMAIMNTINGGSGLLGMRQGPASSVWIDVLLFGVGLPTLLLVGTAWRPVRWALWAVIGLRFLEAATMWMPFGPGDWYQAPENRGFYLVLVVVSLVVCALMAAGLGGRNRV